MALAGTGLDVVERTGSQDRLAPLHVQTWASQSQADEFQDMMNEVVPLLTNYIRQNDDPDELTLQEVDPNALSKLMDFSIPQTGCDIKEIAESIKLILQYSVRTAKSLFVDKLYYGSEPVGQIAELLTAVTNTNVHVYQTAPVFTVMEKELVTTFGAMYGYKNNDGIFCPGGSYSNLISAHLAREKYFPKARLDGWAAEDSPVMFASAQCHYSIRRAAGLLGVGWNNLIEVPANRDGSMDPKALDVLMAKAKAAGQKPFYVCSMAGSTVMGGFDDFQAVAEVCKKHDVWMHIDACWGGSAILSNTHSSLLEGACDADSIAWNPHKGMGIPLQCSLLLVKEHGILEKACTSKAQYLFHSDLTGTAPYMLGEKTLQCGRKNDATKLWLSLKYHGVQGYGDKQDQAFKRARFLADCVKESDKLQLVADPVSLNVNFWYVPEELRGQPVKPAENANVFSRLGKLTSQIYNTYRARGKLLMDYAPLPDHNLPSFFRCIVANPKLSEDDLRFIVKEVESVGDAIVAKEEVKGQQADS